MTTSNPSIVFEHTSDATFRTWGLAVSTALQAVATKTTDTGQIDFATALRPAVNVAAGYDMYRFSDALQATRPIFIKVEYGTSTSATVPAMSITVGTSTNGAGTINSTLATTRRQLNFSSGPSASNPAYFAGGSNWLNFTVPFSFGAFFWFSVSRTLDASGAATSDGALAQGGVSSVSQSDSWLSFNSQTVLTASTSNYLLGSCWLTTAFGSDVFYAQRYAMLPQFCYDLALMAAFPADVTNLVPIAITNLGSSHTYLPVTGIAPNFTGNHCLLMRYE